MKKDLNYYLNLNWTYRFEWSDEDNVYIVSVVELAGCKTHGKTIEEAAVMIKDALKSYVLTCLEFNDSIPEPSKPSDYKGIITYRTTPEKHYKIDKKAVITGKSINKLIDEAVDNLLAS